MEHIYLDYGSTAFPKAPGVGQAMAELYRPSRGQYRPWRLRGCLSHRGSGVGHQGAALPPVWMEQAGGV